MSLRARIALSMTAVMLGPLLAALVLILTGAGSRGTGMDGGVADPFRVWPPVALVAGTAIAVAVLAIRLSRPFAAIDRLNDASCRLADGDLTAQLDLRPLADDEAFGPLARSLTRMGVRVETARGEIHRRDRALAETFEQFGEALASTHDLDALLRTVVEAARRGAGGVVGTVLLGDAGGLSERVSSVPDGVDGVWVGDVLERLTTLAARAVRSGRACAGDLDPLAGGGFALPLRCGHTMVGALAVVRPRGQGPLDDAARAAVQALADHAGTAVANVREHVTAQRLSLTDPLTGAGNVRHLTATLNREVERAHRFGRTLSVLMLDLDHFKQVNDDAGHDFGDAVLREFSARLSGCLREVDMVARRGGEEFTVVLPETGPVGAQAVATRILNRVRDKAFQEGELSRSVTVSIGLASYPDHADSAAGVMHAADVALYEAKRGGRDRWAMASAPTGLAGVIDTTRAEGGLTGPRRRPAGLA